MNLYIAGKITGDPNYKEKFNRVEEDLKAKGYLVMNPAILPNGFEYEQYMKVCFAMIDVSDGIYLLPDAYDSPGAQREIKYVEATRKAVLNTREADR